MADLRYVVNYSKTNTYDELSVNKQGVCFGYLRTSDHGRLANVRGLDSIVLDCTQLPKKHRALSNKVLKAFGFKERIYNGYFKLVSTGKPMLDFKILTIPRFFMEQPSTNIVRFDFMEKLISKGVDVRLAFLVVHWFYPDPGGNIRYHAAGGHSTFTTWRPKNALIKKWVHKFKEILEGSPDYKDTVYGTHSGVEGFIGKTRGTVLTAGFVGFNVNDWGEGSPISEDRFLKGLEKLERYVFGKDYIRPKSPKRKEV